MENLDKLTLQLLSNKNQYNKYLSKEDPARYREHQEYLQKIKKNKHRILGFVKDFLENPDKDFNIEMNEMFSQFAQTSIKYCFMKDLEKRGVCYENDDTDSGDDIMFSNIDKNQGDEEEQDEGQDEDKEMVESITTNKKSFWGSQISKQKSTTDLFFGKR